MTEGEFKRKLRRRIEETVPGVVTIITDPSTSQGIPDRIFLLPNGRFAAVEAKISRNASHRPNQDYYVEKLNSMGYAAFCYPENLEDVVNDIQCASKD